MHLVLSAHRVPWTPQHLQVPKNERSVLTFTARTLWAMSLQREPFLSIS